MNLLYSLLILAGCGITGYGIMKVVDKVRPKVLKFPKLFRVSFLLGAAAILITGLIFLYFKNYLDICSVGVISFAVGGGTGFFVLLNYERVKTKSVNDPKAVRTNRVIFPRKILVGHIVGLQFGAAGAATLVGFIIFEKHDENFLTVTPPFLNALLAIYLIGTWLVWRLVWRELTRYVPERVDIGKVDGEGTAEG